MSSLPQQFDERFSDFAVLQPQFQLLLTQFAEESQMELANLTQYHFETETCRRRNCKILLVSFTKRFPKLLSATAEIIAIFGSTNVCKQFFLIMKANKSFQRSRVTDEHLQITLRLISTDELKPKIEAVANAKYCQLSRKKEN